MKQILLFITLAFFASCSKDEELTQRDAPVPVESVKVIAVSYGSPDISNAPQIDGVYTIEQSGVTIVPATRMHFGQHELNQRIPATTTTIICGWQSSDFTQFTDTFTVDLSGASGEILIERGSKSFAIFVE